MNIKLHVHHYDARNSMKMVRSIINTYWRKFRKGIDLDENLQITLTSLAQYSLALEIEVSILKPFERF
jgi:hypothetical protein